jgi:uncharacterized protein (TIGR04255 family)
VALNAKRYKSAPIVEAVIEIRVQPDAPIDPAALKGLAEELKSTFPKQIPLQRIQMGVTGGQPGGSLNQVVSQSQFGFRLAPPDDSRVLQIRPEGFAFSHLPPYTEWATFRGEAEPLWHQYRKICPTAKLSRCGLRYINRVDIPAERVEIEDYFSLYPEVPDTIPHNDVVSMSLNVLMPQPDINCMAVINEGFGEPVKPGHLSFIFDLDVFRLGIDKWQDTELWEFMDKLRVRKNEIFEQCITDRLRELIDR